MLREQSGAPYDSFYLVLKVLLFEWLLYCPRWYESGVSCNHGRTRTRIVVELDEDAVDDAYHPDTCPHEVQVMLLILLVTSYS